MMKLILSYQAACLGLLAGAGNARRVAKVIYPSRGEKYPGQREAFLVGAWRPMTGAEIRAHNAKVTC